PLIYIKNRLGQDNITYLATVESVNSEKPQLTDIGFYKVRFAFDQSTYLTAQASLPLPLMQCYGDSKQVSAGWHFPLYDGASVLVAMIDGDAQQSIILGVISGAKNGSVVNNSNITENIIRSYLGNELVFDDNTPDAFLRLN